MCSGRRGYRGIEKLYFPADRRIFLIAVANRHDGAGIATFYNYRIPNLAPTAAANGFADKAYLVSAGLCIGMRGVYIGGAGAVAEIPTEMNIGRYGRRVVIKMNGFAIQRISLVAEGGSDGTARIGQYGQCFYRGILAIVGGSFGIMNHSISSGRCIEMADDTDGIGCKAPVAE